MRRRARRIMNTAWMMDEFGMTMAETARELGVSGSTVSQMCCQIMSRRGRARIARTHGAPFDEIQCYVPTYRPARYVDGVWRHDGRSLP